MPRLPGQRAPGVRHRGPAGAPRAGAHPRLRSPRGPAAARSPRRPGRSWSAGSPGDGVPWPASAAGPDRLQVAAPLATAAAVREDGGRSTPGRHPGNRAGAPGRPDPESAAPPARAQRPAVPLPTRARARTGAHPAPRAGEGARLGPLLREDRPSRPPHSRRAAPDRRRPPVTSGDEVGGGAARAGRTPTGRVRARERPLHAHPYGRGRPCPPGRTTPCHHRSARSGPPWRSPR